jgi:tetratricopeptide (TPR) repeat protein
VYKPISAIFFGVIIVSGITIFSIGYNLGNVSYIKLLSGQNSVPHNKGTYTESMAYFVTVSASGSNSINDFNDKGNQLSDIGNYTEAIKYYDKALAIEPNDVDSLYDRGNSLNWIGNYTDAVKYYDKVLAIEPNHTDALNNKGNIFQKTR